MHTPPMISKLCSTKNILLLTFYRSLWKEPSSLMSFLQLASHDVGWLAKPMMHHVTCRTIGTVQVCLMLSASVKTTNFAPEWPAMKTTWQHIHMAAAKATSSSRSHLPTRLGLISEHVRRLILITPGTRI